MLDKLEEVAAELESDMDSSGWMGRTVTLKFKLDTFQGRCFPLVSRCIHSLISLH